MSDPSPFDAPATPETGDAWRIPVSWLLRLIGFGFVAVPVAFSALQVLGLYALGEMGNTDVVLDVFFGGLCRLLCTLVPASALWVAANAIAYPETHGIPALDHNELRRIYDGNRLDEMEDGDPGEYADLPDRDLADVYGAINVNAKRFPELLAAIKQRVESATDADTDD